MNTLLSFIPPNPPLGADIVLHVSGEADWIVDDIYEEYWGAWDFIFCYYSLKTFLAIRGLLNLQDFIAWGGGGGSS